MSGMKDFLAVFCIVAGLSLAGAEHADLRIQAIGNAIGVVLFTVPAIIVMRQERRRG